MKLGVRIRWLEQLGEAIAAWWTRPTARELHGRAVLEAQLRALSRDLRRHHQEQLEFKKFTAIIAAGGVIAVHPSTWLAFLERAERSGLELGGVSVRVSEACPRGHIVAIAPDPRPPRGKMITVGGIVVDLDAFYRT